MSYNVDNAIIMAAGLSSRFAPISYERPKSLITVKGEVLIERQIRQLKEAGIDEIIVVTGYKAELFEYLKEKYGVILVKNEEYLARNNNSSLYVARQYLKNTYVCSSDNYFSENPFEKTVEDSYYAVLFSKEWTNEWCVEEDERGYISKAVIGGENAWYMNGHTFWSERFSKKFVEILEEIYDRPETAGKLWESIYLEHIEELPMVPRKYSSHMIYEFDSLDELREFDRTYQKDSGSPIMQEICRTLNCKEGEIVQILPEKDENGETAGMSFLAPSGKYEYKYKTGKLQICTM